ncbi:MFS transporter [Caulobacter sp. 17J80-11]|uniref:MFS transporter n=1 Tax=Caulobacter sp. 17J80-11 TaxID=2763502 RepID=UPI0021020ABE|nr:MFS transporter [Caulobacter sp. 17J80-11]
MRWGVVGLIAVATVVNYIDRNALAVMWPKISEEIGASKEDYALLVTAFMVAYALGQAAFGKIFDWIGTKLGFAVSIFFWSASIAAHAVAAGLMQFVGARAGLGFSEAGAWPGATKANAEWFPVRERAFAQGIFNAGAALGAIVSAPLIAVLYGALGWKTTFLLVGALGLLWLVPWLALYRSPPRQAAAPAEAEGGETAAADAPAVDIYVPTLRQQLGHRESWGVILSRFFIDPVWWLFVSWLPIYLAETFGFDIKQIGLFGWVPYVGAMIGSLFGGWLSGLLIRLKMPVGLARKLVITLGGAIMLPALIYAARASDPLTAVLIIALVLFGFQIAINNIQTLPGDLFGGKSVGALAGVSGAAAVAGVLITTWLVPVMTQASYAPIFILAAAIVPLSILSVWLLCGRVEPVRAKVAPKE